MNGMKWKEYEQEEQRDTFILNKKISVFMLVPFSFVAFRCVTTYCNLFSLCIRSVVLSSVEFSWIQCSVWVSMWWWCWCCFFYGAHGTVIHFYGALQRLHKCNVYLNRFANTQRWFWTRKQCTRNVFINYFHCELWRASEWKVHTYKHTQKKKFKRIKG